jgi:hypothetical protein
MTGTCTGTFASGTQVVLQATPNAGSTFGGWSGACTGTETCSPDMTADRAVTATFVQATVALNVTGTGTGNGVVTSSPGSLSCTVTKGAGSDTGCSAALPENAAVTLTADPQGGSNLRRLVRRCLFRHDAHLHAHDVAVAGRPWRASRLRVPGETSR